MAAADNTAGGARCGSHITRPIGTTRGHWGAGNVDLALVPQLLLGSVPGIIIGSRLAARVPERVLRSTLSVVLIAVGARMA